LYQPTALRFSDLVLAVKQSGDFIGRECLNLLTFKDEKAHKLSLGNPSLRFEPGYHDMIADPTDRLCIVSIYKAYKKHFPEDYTGPFLRRPRPAKEINQERRRNKQNKEEDKFIMFADLAAKGKFGKNYTTKICNEVAQMAGLEDSRGRTDMKFTGAGRRRAGITAMVSAKEEVPSGELQTSARHKSATTNAGYQAANEGAHSRRYKALMYDGGSDSTVQTKADTKPAAEADTKPAAEPMKKKKKRKRKSSIQQPMMPMQMMQQMMPPQMPMLPMMQPQMPMMPMMQPQMMMQQMMMQHQQQQMMMPMMQQQQPMMQPMMQQQQPMMQPSSDSDSDEY
jgi:hypothetical protein